jgi:uncharacterized protein YbjT (DUF2867 family)
MAITPDYLRDAGEVVSAAASVREAAATWRARDPAMRVVVVDAMDMRGEAAALTLGKRRIFLATTNGHCWSTTDLTEEASALILTED